MDECIPTKLISDKQSIPWITQEIRHFIKRHDMLYSAYTSSGDSVKKKNFQVLQQQLKHKIKRCYQAYLEGLLGLGNNNES